MQYTRTIDGRCSNTGARPFVPERPQVVSSDSQSANPSDPSGCRGIATTIIGAAVGRLVGAGMERALEKVWAWATS